MSKESNVEKIPTSQMPASSNCEHYHSNHHLPDFQIWIRRCSSCGGYDVKDMKQQLKALIASEKLILLDTLSREINGLQTYLLHFDSKDKLVERRDVSKVIQMARATLTQEKNK